MTDARREIEALALRYAGGLDRRDWPAVRAQFADHAEAEGKFGAAPIDEYLAKLREFVEGYGRTMHFSGNRLVTLQGPDRARLESYAIAFHLEPVGGGEPWVAGAIYDDRVELLEDGWKISSRKVRIAWESADFFGPSPI